MARDNKKNELHNRKRKDDHNHNQELDLENVNVEFGQDNEMDNISNNIHKNNKCQ
ncbi:hypothetical protein [Bacillus niameyensis]|uniref:hypothetical protein n=1 Tax=Bacillus niameyensis TaxID=1522308 RepID=UPI000B012739|nr:hypothetical protein [Bacillus niameyensis]